MARTEEVRQDLEQLRQEAADLKKAISRDTSGKRLEIFPCGNTSKWYVFADGQRKYLSKKKKAEASRLAKSAWRRVRLGEVQAEMEACRLYLQNVDGSHKKMDALLKKPDFNDLIGRKDKSVREWQQETFSTNPRHPESLKFQTPSGIPVRSKSEVLIAMELEKYAIPFRYECGLEIPGGGFIYPDFTIMDPKTYRIYIWEHFGLMDDGDYVAGVSRKLSLYMELGYFPDDNLLMTFESGNHPLDQEKVEKLILRTFRPEI